MLIRRRHGARTISQSEWHTFRLRRGEYSDLLILLKKEESLWTFVETKFRYDYNPSTETLVLRMPNQLHEVFIARVVVEIQKRLSMFADAESRSRAFAQSVNYNGSGRLDLEGEDNDGRRTIRRDPDATFKHCDALWPGVVIEVSYSQKKKALPHLADDYILGTDGNIRVVVGLDIDYETKKGTISIWRPEYVTNEQGQLDLEAAQTVEDQIFRDEFGNPNLSPDAGLKLELRDFATERLAEGVSGSFLIDSAALCRFLEEAEQEDKRRQGDVQSLLPGAKKRRREYTPPDEVNSEDERRLAEDERRVRARESEDDSSYKSSQ